MKPGFTAPSRAKLWTSQPAPAVKTIASATSTTIRRRHGSRGRASRRCAASAFVHQRAHVDAGQPPCRRESHYQGAEHQHADGEQEHAGIERHRVESRQRRPAKREEQPHAGIGEQQAGRRSLQSPARTIR